MIEPETQPLNLKSGTAPNRLRQLIREYLCGPKDPISHAVANAFTASLNEDAAIALLANTAPVTAVVRAARERLDVPYFWKSNDENRARLARIAVEELWPL